MKKNEPGGDGLLNLGKVSRDWLDAAGIRGREDLKRQVGR